MKIEPERPEPGFADRIQVEEIVREEPGAAIADVSKLNGEVLQELALQREAPLRHLRHLARIRVDPRGWNIDLSWCRPDAGIVRHAEQIIPVVNQTVPQDVGRL